MMVTGGDDGDDGGDGGDGDDDVVLVGLYARHSISLL